MENYISTLLHEFTEKFYNRLLFPAMKELLSSNCGVYTELMLLCDVIQDIYISENKTDSEYLKLLNARLSVYACAAYEIFSHQDCFNMKASVILFSCLFISLNTEEITDSGSEKYLNVSEFFYKSYQNNCLNKIYLDSSEVNENENVLIRYIVHLLLKDIYFFKNGILCSIESDFKNHAEALKNTYLRDIIMGVYAEMNLFYEERKDFSFSPLVLREHLNYLRSMADDHDYQFDPVLSSIISMMCEKLISHR